MLPWRVLDRASVPGSPDELVLHQRGEELSIRSGGRELMNSRMHGSEEALAALGCESIATREKARVLIGGLGMGFTLAKALTTLAPDAEVIVAELVPAVVAWNRGPLAHLAGMPLADPRVTVRELDVGKLIRRSPAGFDAILLDVDNGPEAFTRNRNEWLYGKQGLMAARAALRPGGVLGIWAVSTNDEFTYRLRVMGFAVDIRRVAALASRVGKRTAAQHTIWLAKPVVAG